MSIRIFSNIFVVSNY